MSKSERMREEREVLRFLRQEEARMVAHYATVGVARVNGWSFSTRSAKRAQAIDVDSDRVPATLKRLARRGLVTGQRGFWALTDAGRGAAVAE